MSAGLENGLDMENSTSSDRALFYGLARERAAELDRQLEWDEERHKAKRRPRLSPEKARLARASEAAALERLEAGARTVADFETIIEIWNRRDQNRERRERYREVHRDKKVPLEYGAANDGLYFPRFLMNPTLRQVSSGSFLDVLNDCPFDMHNLTADPFQSKIVEQLRDEQKEVLYFLYLRLYKAKEIAAMRGQTDRNIRKVRDTLLRKLHQQLYQHLKGKEEKKRPLSGRESNFIERYEADSLDADTDD